ncbi:MAG: aminopeptidase [Gemmatimonadaceae bacterium]
MRRLNLFTLPKTAGGWTARSVLLLLGLLSLLPLPRYVARAAWEEWKILRVREPIERVLADLQLPPNERSKLALVLAARTFASESLGLPAQENFTQFSRLDRDTLVLVLSAARRDTLALHTWWFPIVGRVPYKGYFDFQAALSEARVFERRGYDIDLRPAAAFSTLGWFDDPLLSTTLRQDSIALVNTVVHELTHNRLFVKGHVEFNESFASFVGSRGSAAFFRARGDSAALKIIAQRWEDEQLRATYVAGLFAALDSAYSAHPGDSLARVRARDSVYARAMAQLVDSLTRDRSDSVAHRVQLRMRFNNASLLARRVYGRNLPLFDSVFAALGSALRPTIDSVAAVAGSATEPFAAVRDLLKRARTNSLATDERRHMH